MFNVLTAAQIVKAYNGYAIDYKNSEEHKMAIDLRNEGNSNRAWNRPCPEIVMVAKRELAA